VKLPPWPNEKGDVTEIDGVALPTLIDYLAVAFIVSLAGFPVVVPPAARAGNGLPVGIRLIGAPGRDADLLALAARI
jgi:amidase